MKSAPAATEQFDKLLAVIRETPSASVTTDSLTIDHVPEEGAQLLQELILRIHDERHKESMAEMEGLLDVDLAELLMAPQGSRAYLLKLRLALLAEQVSPLWRENALGAPGANPANDQAHFAFLRFLLKQFLREQEIAKRLDQLYPKGNRLPQIVGEMNRLLTELEIETRN